MLVGAMVAVASVPFEHSRSDAQCARDCSWHSVEEPAHAVLAAVATVMVVSAI